MIWILTVVLWTNQLEPLVAYTEEFRDAADVPAWDLCRRRSEYLVANPATINLKETDVVTARCAPKEKT